MKKHFLVALYSFIILALTGNSAFATVGKKYLKGVVLATDTNFVVVDVQGKSVRVPKKLFKDKVNFKPNEIIEIHLSDDEFKTIKNR